MLGESTPGVPGTVVVANALGAVVAGWKAKVAGECTPAEDDGGTLNAKVPEL